MKSKLLRRLLFTVAIVAFIGIAGGYLLWNRPHRDVMHADAITTDAVSLYNSFITDSVSAKSTYLNEVLAVSGEVKNISLNQQKEQVILFKTSEPDASVNCTLEGEPITVQMGDFISLQGICIGYMGGDASFGLPGDVFMIRCHRTS